MASLKVQEICDTSHLYMPEDHMENLYDSANPLVKFVHLQRLDAIAKLIPRSEKIVFLDAGCGEGHLIERLYQQNPGREYYGVDITPAALEKAKERCSWGTFKQAYLSSTEFPDDFFDCIVCTEVIEHVNDYQTVIQELKRILKPGGSLMITFPNEVLWTVSRFLLKRKPVKVPDHINSFNPRVMNSLVNLKLERRQNLPFELPFFLSLGCLMKFIKSDS